MATLHTFGCSITQGFALPDVVKPILNQQTGLPLTNSELQDMRDRGIEIDWTEIHLNQPSQYAWPQLLADRLDLPLVNHARRGSCFRQIARQCVIAAPDIKPDDIVIVMWTYLSRLSLQWPARTAVPFSNTSDPGWGWRTVIMGFNKFFGLSPSKTSTQAADQRIQQYIHDATRYTYLDPMGMYDRYYNSLVLQQLTHNMLAGTAARVIHLSVEDQPAVQQLEQVRSELDESLKYPYVIPDPQQWYTVPVDNSCVPILLDPSIPLAENDLHPSMTHHSNFADWVYNRYFQP